MEGSALSHIRICDFTGQLAGAGATRFLAAFGAQVIRIDDPTNQGRWDILRGLPPFVDERRGINLGGAYNNHNVEKLGITLNLRTERGKGLLRQLIATSDVVAENFAAGVLARLGFPYDELRKIKPDIVYVSDCGFGHTGPYTGYKTWGPSVQAVSGLTFSSGLPDQPPAGWGYSYMDHTGAYYAAMAILMALHHRDRTGEGQWVDYATTESALTLNGPALLDYTVNGRPLRRPGMPNSNRSQFPAMAPHGIYEGRGMRDEGRGGATNPSPDPHPSSLIPHPSDSWVAIACRDDADWRALGKVVGEPWVDDPRFSTLVRRLEHEDELDDLLGRWTAQRDTFATAEMLQGAGVPAAAVQSPEQRIDLDPNTAAWGLWPEAIHTEMGRVRVDGLPVHLSETDWSITRGAPCLGEHNDLILGGLFGLSTDEIADLHNEGVL